jgi:two-component system alkaline phosphatase synthesis response regulator PhoP
MKVVVLDDDRDIVELLKYNLEKEGIETICYTKPKEALEKAAFDTPDAYITDWMMPEIDGIDFAKKIKFNPKTSQIPLMMISAKNEEGDVVTSLEFGFDDYMAKPFGLKEFVARVKRMIKRKKEMTAAVEFGEDTNTQAITFDGLRIDPSSYTASIDGKKIELTITEFKLLELLASKPGRVFSREVIIEKINGMDYFVSHRSIDVQVVNLRRKLGDYKSNIVTIRSVGYSFKRTS